MKLRMLFTAIVVVPVAFIWWTFGPKPDVDDIDWFDI